MKTIKTWVVDPFARTITRADMEPDSLEAMYTLLSSPEGYAVDCIASAGKFANGDAVIIDDNGKLYGELERQRFFMLSFPEAGAMGGYLIAGRALIVGIDDEGASVDAASTVYDISRHVIFFPEYMTEAARRAAVAEVSDGPIVISL